MDIRDELEADLNLLLERLQVSPAPAPETMSRMAVPSSPEFSWQ